MGTIKKQLWKTLKDASSTTITLLKIMIPVSIIVKLFEMTGSITTIGTYLSPVMKLVGLPGETGLVWATAMITNIYGGLLVFISLSSQMVFTGAQVTVLATMILIAHSLPIEVTIARKAGVRIWFTLLWRIGCAFIFGMILSSIFTLSGLFQTTSAMVWQPESMNISITGWVFNQLKNYLMIFLIVFSLLLLLRFLENIGAIAKINRIFEPGLEKLGMSKDAGPLTIIGTTLGISYGGGLIIKEARSGKLKEKDAFLSVSLMGLSHSLIEDTLLMLTLGASLLGILVGRVILTLLAMLILIQIINRLTYDVFHRWLYA
jgi:spore maturation protein SpmB